jgi:K+-transporting ATPase ATPase A chain
MIGRTPEFLGKRLGVDEMKLVTIYTLMGPLAVLVPAAIAALTPAGLDGLTTNHGRHGLTENLFAFASSTANGSPSAPAVSQRAQSRHLDVMRRCHRPAHAEVCSGTPPRAWVGM